MKRRDFVFTASALLLTTACHRRDKSPIAKKGVNFNRGKKTTLKLATSWPAHFPIMGTAVDEFANRFGKLEQKEDEFLKFISLNPTLDEALEKFGQRVYEAELEGIINIENGKCYLK